MAKLKNISEKREENAIQFLTIRGFYWPPFQAVLSAVTICANSYVLGVFLLSRQLRSFKYSIIIAQTCIDLFVNGFSAQLLFGFYKKWAV